MSNIKVHRLLQAEAGVRTLLHLRSSNMVVLNHSPPTPIFWPCCVACGILVPQSEIKLVPPAVETQHLSHCTRDILSFLSHRIFVQMTAPGTPIVKRVET